jgi:hypothetical protein
MAVGISAALELAAEVGRQTARLRFRIGCSFEQMLRSLSGREIQAAWETLGARLIIHTILEAEEGSEDNSLRSACEFIANCRGLFQDCRGPAFDVEGDSSEAAVLAIKHGDCLWRHPGRPNQVYADALPVLHFGKEVGLVISIAARQTREEALELAAGFHPEGGRQRLPQPASWQTPALFDEETSENGRNAILAGSFEQVARAIHEYKHYGISQILIRELTGQHETVRFRERVLPLIRAMEIGKAEA